MAEKEVDGGIKRREEGGRQRDEEEEEEEVVGHPYKKRKTAQTKKNECSHLYTEPETPKATLAPNVSSIN